MIEFNIYGLKKNEFKPYMEDLIFNTKNIKDIEKALIKALNKGYHHLRVSKIDLSIKPNFTNTLNL